MAIKISNTDVIDNNRRIVNLAAGTAAAPSVSFTDDANTGMYRPEANTLAFSTDGEERMRITNLGRVGIGTSLPGVRLDVAGGIGRIIPSGGSANSQIHGAGTLNVYGPDSGPTVRTGALRIECFSDQGANVGTGISFSNRYITGDNRSWSMAKIGAYKENSTSWNAAGYLAFATTTSGGALVERMRISTIGTVTIYGALSKGSGSFKIDHPLKPDTHHLVHSFIEGPQADLIYRGKVSLVNGQATVNIDEAGRMTESTFEALNRNVQCFTNNESGWTAVRGSVSGNILTIEAQDENCTDEISWMVIGERCDQHMIDTDWTDENGRVITEPEKEQKNAD